MNKRPARITLDLSLEKLAVAMLTLVVFFVLPVVLLPELANYDSLVTFEKTSSVASSGSISPTTRPGRIAGLLTVKETNNYYLLPVVNFKLDKNLREQSTIWFLLGAALLTLAVVSLLISATLSLLRK